MLFEKTYVGVHESLAHEYMQTITYPFLYVHRFRTSAYIKNIFVVLRMADHGMIKHRYVQILHN